jgi:alkanesulfonate monooxygenase SsuD/methylene tetrahydromethanopterin reductase-like flavin-dependent oxidoreductase (luciferase family)
MLLPALEIYRARFKPSRQLARPHVMVACNVICAPTDAEAQWLATTQRQSAVNLLRGRRALSSPPVDDMDALWTPAEKAQAMRLLARSMIGSPQTVRLELEAFVAETRADEVIMVTDVYDHAARLRSVEMTARVMEASEARMEASEARMEASEA